MRFLSRSTGARSCSYTVYSMNKEYISQTELALLLGVSKATVCRMVGRREIEFVRVGRQIRFSPEAIKAWETGVTVPIRLSGEVV